MIQLEVVQTTEGLVQQHLAAMAGDEQVESFLLSIIFVAGDCFVAVNPPLTARCKQLWPIKTLKEGEL
jgi:hypothetical protein